MGGNGVSAITPEARRKIGVYMQLIELVQASDVNTTLNEILSQIFTNNTHPNRQDLYKREGWGIGVSRSQQIIEDLMSEAEALDPKKILPQPQLKVIQVK